MAGFLRGVQQVQQSGFRREVRVAGLWLLALIPPTVACATWGGGRSAVLLAVRGPAEATAAEPARVEAPAVAISLSLEPVDDHEGGVRARLCIPLPAMPTT